jgi:hypothetical protein
MGKCVQCGKDTKLEISEPEINYYDYKCGKCRGYNSDKEYINEQNRYDKELYKEYKKSKKR